MPGSLAFGAVAAVVLGLAAPGCGTADSAVGDSFTLGYFPNITHAPALIGVERGTFAEVLGEDVDFATQTFNAGPDAINALFSGEIDATFIGPNPAINGWAESDGTALRIIAGATTVDPIAESLRGSAEHAEDVGLLDPVGLDGIYALDPLNDLLQEEGRAPVPGLSDEEGR